MGEILAAARLAWPDFDVPEEEFAAWVKARDPDATHAADLYLACACARGDPKAHAAFDASLLPQAAAAAARIDPSLADEVAQRLREDLFVKGRIAQYSGRGALGGWLRVCALRIALRMRPTPAPPDAARALLTSGSPEIDLLKMQGKDEVEHAFRESLKALSDRDRLLLGMHYADGLSLERIGALYRQHRATIARQMARARRELLDGARELLRRKLRLSESECDSLVALVRSQLRISLGARESPPP